MFPASFGLNAHAGGCGGYPEWIRCQRRSALRFESLPSEPFFMQPIVGWRVQGDFRCEQRLFVVPVPAAAPGRYQNQLLPTPIMLFCNCDMGLSISCTWVCGCCRLKAWMICGRKARNVSGAPTARTEFLISLSGRGHNFRPVETLQQPAWRRVKLFAVGR